MDDYVKKMESDLGYKIPKDSPLFETLSLLNKYNALPNLKLENLADSYGYFNKIKNQIVLDKRTAKDINLPTHEYTHALDRVMAKQFDELFKKPEEERTKEEQQFLSAYLKLMPGLTKVPPDESVPREMRFYRYSPSELRAFGTGFYGGGKFMDGKTQGHMDATMATEMAVLRELLSRQKTQEQNPFYQDPFGTMQYVAP